MVVKTV